MKEQRRPEEVREPMRKPNWTVIALIAGLLLLVFLIAYFATSRNPDQDKLTNLAVSTSTTPAPSREKLCASNSTYDSIKRELFHRAAQARGSDQAAYDRLAAFAVVRMEHPVMETEDRASGAVNCSGSLSLDLPPGVEIAGGRHSLTSDVDYTVDANGNVVLRNADAIIAPLATLSQVAGPPQTPTEGNEVESEQNVTASQSANVRPGAQTPVPGRPSFDCSTAHTRGEVAVCSDARLSALDLNMATEFGRASAIASPEQRDLLRETARRFYAYRDHCSDRQCIADAYMGRIREIREIIEGRWQAPR